MYIWHFEGDSSATALQQSREKAVTLPASIQTQKSIQVVWHLFYAFVSVYRESKKRGL